ncbi:hypothetical protein [Mycobacterium ostraviense]|nr:hypothetical protein [Mycobacterium ostraviense]
MSEPTTLDLLDAYGRIDIQLGNGCHPYRLMRALDSQPPQRVSKPWT